MREGAFREYLASRLGARSVDSYVAYCNRVMREVGTNFDHDDLSETALLAIASELDRRGAPPTTVRNCLSAVRAYAAFRQGAAEMVLADSAPGHGMHITNEQRRAWLKKTASSPFNLWLDEQLRDETGAFELEKLYALAERFGINKRTAYAHLNAGQQRMNLGNLLRRVVPAAEYSKFEDGQLRQPVDATTKPAALAASPISGMGVREMLILYSQIMDELRAREIVRTSNSPVGDYGELLFSRAFGWSLEGNSARGYDATDASGVRFQIKARRLATPSGSRQLSAIRRLTDNSFDQLAAVLFDRSFAVMRAILLPHTVVAERAKRREHTNSWVFMLDDRVWSLPGAIDVTDELTAVQATL